LLTILVDATNPACHPSAKARYAEMNFLPSELTPAGFGSATQLPDHRVVDRASDFIGSLVLSVPVPAIVKVMPKLANVKRR